MDRREVLKGVGGIALAALAQNAFAEAHEHHHHHDGGTPNAKLLETTGTCLIKGEICINHCLMLLADGDKDMAACAKTVRQMLSVCTSLQQLASQQSAYLGEMAKLAAKVCKDCEDECRKHENEHSECKDCAEACAACRKECNALAA